MVKNTAGGNKSKGFARKHNNGGNKNNILRVSQDEGEIYAIVTKMCGNGMFECYCIDEVMRLGQNIGKFTGKGKRDNIVNNGTWVLIGVREWDIKKEEESMCRKTCLSKDEKLPKCDLLEVYNDKEKEQLQEEIAEKWSILIKRDPSRIEEQNDDDNGIVDGGFKFATDKDIERERLLKEAKMATSEKITLETTIASTESTETTDASTAADWVSIDEL
jgi:translation initiation factor IF-1